MLYSPRYAPYHNRRRICVVAGKGQAFQSGNRYQCVFQSCSTGYEGLVLKDVKTLGKVEPMKGAGERRATVALPHGFEA